MRIKFMTYDARRDEDIIHLETDQCNVMILNPEYSYSTSSGHPFRYGKVLGILHADVGYVGSLGRSEGRYTYTHMEFLWVRWYEVRPASGPYELDKTVLLPIDEPGCPSLTFVDPLDVLRACHIVPRFESERRFHDGIGKSYLAQDGSDWNEYCINR